MNNLIHVVYKYIIPATVGTPVDPFELLHGLEPYHHWHVDDSYPQPTCSNNIWYYIKYKLFCNRSQEKSYNYNSYPDSAVIKAMYMYTHLEFLFHLHNVLSRLCN